MDCGKLKGFSVAALLLLLCSACGGEFTVSVDPFEISVVDENGDPVEGALVLVSYRTSHGAHAVVDGVLHAVEARTDEYGKARFAGWEKKTTKGFGSRDPTITVAKFGYLTQYDGTVSEREKARGVFYVRNLHPAITPVFVLKECAEEGGTMRERCMSQAYYRLHTLVGPAPISVKKKLPEYAKEEARHENYQRSIR